MTKKTLFSAHGQWNEGGSVMTYTRAWIAILALLVAAPGWAAQPLGCLIEPERVAEVGSPVTGVIESMLVERGDLVRKGQLIAVLRTDVERASVNVAHSKAESSADMKAAAANLAFTRQRLVRAEDLFKKEFISGQALDQARAEVDVAEQKLIQAREIQRVSQRELELANAQLAQRMIRSPIDGVIAERYFSPGERVEDKALVRVVKFDPLRVQMVVPSALFGKIQAGASATVMPDLPGVAPATARVTLVDKVVDAASNTFRVQLELPNPNLALPAGLRCKANFAQEVPLARNDALNNGARSNDAHTNDARTNDARGAPPVPSGMRPTALKLDSSLSLRRPPAAVAAKRI